MIKKYKTFFNIILFLSLVLVPSYGYSGIRKADFKLFESALQKQHPDFKPPPYFNKVLVKIMEVGEAMEAGELKSYLAKNPTMRSHLNLQWLETSEFKELFRIIKEIHTAIEMEKIEGYLVRNPGLADYFDDLNRGVTEFDTFFYNLREQQNAGSRLFLAWATQMVAFYFMDFGHPIQDFWVSVVLGLGVYIFKTASHRGSEVNYWLDNEKSASLKTSDKTSAQQIKQGVAKTGSATEKGSHPGAMQSSRACPDTFKNDLKDKKDDIYHKS